jgi:arginyl-tRNA synthetase
MEIAEQLVSFIPVAGAINRVWTAPPGFVNFELKQDWLQGQATSINEVGDSYGNTQTGLGQNVQVEFVSVNPTGPIHVGHARGAVLGSVLADVMAAAGYNVTREYYVNDAGSQMQAFYGSLYARYAEALGKRDVEFPENGYRGEYMVEIGQELATELGNKFLDMPQEQGVAEIGAVGLDRMLVTIGRDLARVGVSFDVWFRERDLFRQGQYDKAMGLLEEQGYTAHRDGAKWFTSTALGEEKDNVLVRSTGQPTYFASDVAYHFNKFVERGFDRVIDIWGADHQGHVPRMKAVVGALGVDPERLTILIAQLVALRRGGEIMRVSKRTGELITLKELVDEVGADACRYFFLARAAESQMEFDLELAKKESTDNPVYYVQYAHARIASILKLARERDIDWSDGDVSLLTHEAELALIRKMVVLPELVATIAKNLTPHVLPHYATELATAFHWFYDHCRVVSSNAYDMPMTKARLQLCQASKTVLARTLTLMGMSTPEQM